MPTSKGSQDLQQAFLTAEFRAFVQHWSPVCGLFPNEADQLEHELKLVVEAELMAAGRDVYAMFQKSLLVQEPKWRALDRLLRELDDYIASYEIQEGGVGWSLRRRIDKARSVLGLTELVR